ncbi:hypothetical protein ACFL2J_01645 [Candidatus Omnitrophota bacterium]
MRKYLTNEKGSMLAMSMIFLTIFTLMGYGLINLSAIDAIEVVTTDRSMQAFWVAEAGLSRALYSLRMDFVSDSTAPSLADGDINGFNCGPDNSDFYIIPYPTNSVGNGTYVVEMKNVSGSDKEAWVKSTGTVGGTSRTVQVYLGVENRNIWNNAIFARGASESSQNLINGNVTIAGSVHILGERSDGIFYLPTEVALDMSGGARIINNYEPVDPELLNIMPPCPKVTVIENGTEVELDSLSAQVKVQHGNIFIDSSASGIGEADVPGNQYKETVDAVYQNDGYTGSQGENEVFSDNGPFTPYDFKSHYVPFPSLEDPYMGYPSHYAFLQDNGLVITDSDQLAELADITHTSNFDYDNGKGRISMDGNGHLTIDGIVYIGNGAENDGDGAHLTISTATEVVPVIDPITEEPVVDPITGEPVTQNVILDITYSGSAAILVTGNVQIDGDFFTEGTDSYPDNIIGLMTPHNIHFGDSSQIDVAGVFYAEESISAEKQTEVAGAWVSNSFDMGKNVPSIYQVWAIMDHLPFGLIGSNPHYTVAPSSWEEI